MNVNELAAQLLMTRVKAYIQANPTSIPNAGIPAQWYPQCLELAQAIITVTDVSLPAVGPIVGESYA
jgi:hypothetical protein